MLVMFGKLVLMQLLTLVRCLKMCYQLCCIAAPKRSHDAVKKTDSDVAPKRKKKENTPEVGDEGKTYKKIASV